MFIKSRPRHRLDDLTPQPQAGSALKTIGRCVAGWLTGYLISCVSSILFFRIGHINPELPASTGIMWLTAIYGIVFVIIAAIVGTSFSRQNALTIGATIAATIIVIAMWSWYETPSSSHWTQAIAILLMAPSAQFTSIFRRTD